MAHPSPATRYVPSLGCRVLVQDWTCCGFLIPKGYKTDGVSFIIKDNRADAAGVLHDWLVDNMNQHGLDLAACRRLFKEKMTKDGVPVRRRILYLTLLKGYDSLPRVVQLWLRSKFLRS